ncbi:MAG: amino acid adenylation domain-containing protein [Balneolaceae bacterium]
MEACLTSFPLISSSVVTVRRGESGNELAGYVVFQSGVDGTSQLSSVREHLAKQLPDYMIPASFVVLDEMPLTPNGKADRKALPEPGREQQTRETDYVAPETRLERLLATLWQDVLHVENVGVRDNFFEMGGDSIKGAIFANRMQQQTGAVFYVVALFEAPTISELVDYMRIHYPDTVSAFGDGEERTASGRRLSPADLATLRNAIEPLAPYPQILKTPKNRRAIFVLAPPRSGTTLLRVLLGGHSQLFAPPELELMPFNTLDERSETYTGGDSFWLEGTLRAVMELKNCDADSAKAMMAEREAAGMSVKDFYGEMQEWLGERMLVDKSPSYVLDPLILQRIEETFEDPLYIHLHRHPCGMIRSFEEARLQQIFFRYPHSFTPGQLAELIWTHSHRTISGFLESVPDSRKLQISFEQMTRDAQVEVERMCRFIGIDFQPEMLAIHEEQEKKRRMTDGIHKESTMLGDVKFHTHKRIDATAADRWRESYDEDFLSNVSRETALELGYEGAHVSLIDAGADTDTSQTGIQTGARNGISDSRKESQKDKAWNNKQTDDTGRNKITEHSRDKENTQGGKKEQLVSERPLSFSQQRLWFLDQLEGSGNTYNMPVALWLNGPLDTEALLRAVMAIPARHEVLRSRFIMENGEPVCLLEETLPPPTIVDLQLLDPEEKEKEAVKWLEQESNRSFDLAKGPLFRAVLVKLSPERHLLMITMHHIVSDGWSVGIVSGELEQFYKHYSGIGSGHHIGSVPGSEPGDENVLVNENGSQNGNAAGSAPEPLAKQYSDYATWQQKLFRGGELDRQLAYWKDQLSDSPALLELPADHPRPVMKSYEGKTIQFNIGADLTEKVRKLAENTGSTLYMTLLAVFGVLMNRYSGQTVIPVGSPVANRRDMNFEPLIGFFVNTLVMKVTVDPEESFRQLLKRVRQMALEAYSNQDVSFEQIVDELQPERNMGYSPLFQVMMTMQAGGLTLPKLSGIEAEVADYSNTISKYDLTLLFSEEKGGLTGSLEYSTDLFEEWRIRQIGENFIELLTGITTNPSACVKQLPLLPSSTQDRVLKEWNRTDTTFTTPDTLPETIRQTAARHPERIALVCGESELSYGDLERRSNRLAHLLLSLGVEKQSRVAVAIGRSIDMVVSLLAILKTGCSYVPLDPTYPANRIEMIFEDAGIEWLLTHSSLQESMPVCDRVVCIDQVMPDLDDSQYPDTPPVTEIRGEDLAYVIFTSGSTGRPKGVMIPHRAMLNFLNSMIEKPGISADDTVLAVTTIAFDIAVLELWASLVSGAGVAIASEKDVRDGEALLDLIRRRKITLMQATPATWNLLVESGWEGTPELKCLCGGEAMPRQLADELLTRCGTVWNMYGPTETTVWSSIQQIEGVGRTTEAVEPIGRPIANTCLYILDDELNPVPPGVPGELYIGGKGVAAGYLNQPEMTADRFLPDPFREAGRMYRTGDLARYRPDGVTEYLGRMDQQVKLRGYRIEPGEIEHQLRQFPGILHCAVVIQGDGVEARLAAFYVLEHEENPVQATELKAFLHSRLPDYMVPTVYVALEEMPLTPNGKMDRKALKSMEGGREMLGSVSGSSARDIAELRLLNIWQELLDDPSVGHDDNFFDAGGHSLIAVRLMAAIGVEFGRHLPLATLFQNPTVAQLARQLKKEGSSDLWSPLVEIRPGSPGNRPLFCAPGAGGNVLYLQPLSKFIRKETPFWGLQPAGLDGLSSPATTVEELASCYIEGIEKLNPDGPWQLSGHSFGGTVAFEMARQLRQKGREVGRLILLDSPAPQWIIPTGLDWPQAEWLAQVAQIASHQYGVSLGLSAESFAGLNEEEQLYRLQQRLIETGVFPADSNINYLRGFMDVYRSNLQMEYKPEEEKVDVDLLLIRSADLQPGEIADEKAIQIRSQKDLGWSRWIGGKLDVVEAPGDHLTMLNPPHVEKLAVILNRTLSETGTLTPSPTQKQQ